MPTRTANAMWNGRIQDGEGRMEVGSGTVKEAFSFGTRFEDQPGTNPEELVGAAHAGCFSMALSKTLEDAGFTPEHIETSARVTVDKQGDGFAMTDVALDTRARVPGIEEPQFQELVEKANQACVVSQALNGPRIEVRGELQQS
jgi:osmotically inducible protein OsmC